MEFIRVENLSKKFCHSIYRSFFYSLADFSRKVLGLKPKQTLRRGEFHALQDLNFSVSKGECLGIIGPNGAGKSTLLKLIARLYLPDRGRISNFGAIKSLIQIGQGLQPLLSGRENIYIQCHELGLNKTAIDAKLQEIIAFADLNEFIDAPVKTYSDGMYARLEFSIAAHVPLDILLIDEVLAVGDISFQIRALEKLDQLKRAGMAILFVSHSEMNVRQIADRCLLLFNGRQIALGEPDTLYSHYYAAMGYLNKPLKALGAIMQQPADFKGAVSVESLRWVDKAVSAKPLELVLSYRSQTEEACLSLQFWNVAGILVTSIPPKKSRLKQGTGEIRIHIPFLTLSPGLYQVAVSFSEGKTKLCYQKKLMELPVSQAETTDYGGLTLMEADFK